jgi:hypothetical protein
MCGSMKSIPILWLSAWFSNVTVSQYVDDLEPMLRANRDGYFPGPRNGPKKDYRRNGTRPSCTINPEHLKAEIPATRVEPASGAD